MAFPWRKWNDDDVSPQHAELLLHIIADVRIESAARREFATRRGTFFTEVPRLSPAIARAETLLFNGTRQLCED
jgi:hypothetical protein